MRSSQLSAVLILAVFVSIGLPQQDLHSYQDRSVQENNWHQWRGPMASGVAPGATPPIQWSEESNVAWKVPVEGEGISTPIVWEDKVFLITAVPTERKPDKPVVKDDRAMTSPPNQIIQFKVVCLSLKTGETIWQDVCTELAPHEGRHQSSTYAAASPMTDGRRLNVPFGSFGKTRFS